MEADTIVSGISAIVSMIFALVPHRRANAAKLAAVRSAVLTLWRQLSVTASEVVDCTIRIDNTANRCKGELRDYATFTGNLGNSRPGVLTEAIEAKQTNIGPNQTRAREISDTAAEYKEKSEEEITEVQSGLEGFLVQTSRILDELEDELARYEADNRMHRENLLRG